MRITTYTARGKSRPSTNLDTLAVSVIHHASREPVQVWMRALDAAGRPVRVSFHLSPEEAEALAERLAYAARSTRITRAVLLTPSADERGQR